ncbi:MAG: helix-turn-helix domain-containing protein [Clostridia bacterium]|nr:helix-turn-helix domain-containing protein [Clostridia bacterium]
MYQIVLISSSKQVTEDFRKRDLQSANFELMCVTEDVDEAILKKPHVLLCPAKSSVVDGLQIAKQAHDENWSTKVILYGRRTYECVHLAMDAHAFGYLSMPMDNAEVVHTLLGLKTFLDKNNILENTENQEDIPLLREYFFYNLCQGSLKDYEQAETSFRNLIPFENAGELAVTKLVISDFSDYLASRWKYGKDSLYTAVSNFLIKNDAEDFTVAVHRDGKEMCFLTVSEQKNGKLKERLDSKNRETEQNVKDLMQMEIIIREPIVFSSMQQMLDYTSKNPLLPVNARFEQFDETESREMTEREGTVIGNAKEYINNCYNKEIGLDDVADFVQLSPAYFSRLFKQETGENFIDYLIKVRMEHGKRLLETTTYKTYEISQMVGYKKSKYFSKLFKKYSGYTATEYRSYVNRKRQKKQLDRM